MATNNSHAWAYSDAPEAVGVVPLQQPGLELVEHSTLEAVRPGEEEEAWKLTGQQDSTLEPNPDNDNTSAGHWNREATPTSKSPAENTPALANEARPAWDEDGGIHSEEKALQPRCRNRRKWYTCGGLVAILAIAAIVLGCVLGLRSKGNSTT